MKIQICSPLIAFLCGFALFCNAQTKEIRHYVNFDYDKDILKDDAKASIDSLVSTLDLDLNMYEVHLEGHTDSDGSLKYNLDLSMRRSKAVKKYLANEKKFNDNQIVIDGKSFLEPVSTNENDKGKARNRRVEIRLVAKLSPLQVPFETWHFNAEEGMTYTFERSGTVLRIPPNALQNPDGSTAKGEARLEYREFRDAADFIAFGITMRFGDGWFNSAGMFEIRVFQGDTPLQLPTYKPMEIRFQLTDTLPNLNFYEYVTAKTEWRELGKINPNEPIQEYRTQNTPDKKEVRQNCFVPFSVSTKPIKDTLKTFFDAMQLASGLAHRSGALTELYKTGFVTFDDRWKRSNNYKNYFYASAEYVGDISYLDILNNKQYYNIQLKTEQPKVDQNTKRVTFEIRDLGGKHPELRTLKDRIWSFNTRSEKGGQTRIHMFLSNWTDARLEHKGGSQFKLTIKGREKYMEMDITGELTKKDKAEGINFEDIYKRYESALNRRRRELDDSITFAHENWGYFLMFAKTLMPADEQCMSLGEWVQYFENNIYKMQSRYDSLWHSPFNSITLNMIKKAMGRLPISPTLDPVAPVDVPPFVRVLSVDGFGVFNCDQIQRLGNATQLIATYVDESGNAIEPESLSLVDYSINSVLTFPPNQIAYNPASRTALVLAAKNGSKYILRADAFAKLLLKNKKSFTFQMEDITAQLKSVDDLRKELSL